MPSCVKGINLGPKVAFLTFICIYNSEMYFFIWFTIRESIPRKSASIQGNHAILVEEEKEYSDVNLVSKTQFMDAMKIRTYENAIGQPAYKANKVETRDQYMANVQSINKKEDTQWIWPFNMLLGCCNTV